MKHFTVALAFVFSASFVQAQTSPETYLSQIPAIPIKSCNIASAEKASFDRSVRSLKDRMDKDIVQRKEDIQIYLDANRDAITAHLEKQPGSVEKITGKSGKMQEGKKGRPENAQPDLKIQKPPQQLKPVESEQKDLQEKIYARKTALMTKFKALDHQAAMMKEKEITPLHRQLSLLGNVVVSKEQTKQMAELAVKLKDAQKRYCETYSPQYLALLEEYLSAVKISLPDYRRLEEMTAKTQMGLDKPIDANNGLMGIEALREYLTWLSKAHKYDLPYEY